MNKDNDALSSIAGGTQTDFKNASNSNLPPVNLPNVEDIILGDENDKKGEHHTNSTIRMPRYDNSVNESKNDSKYGHDFKDVSKAVHGERFVHTMHELNNDKKIDEADFE
jgi:hypothetical protein